MKLVLHEELGAVGVGAFVGHGEQERLVVLALEALICGETTFHPPIPWMVWLSQPLNMPPYMDSPPVPSPAMQNTRHMHPT